MIQWRDEMESGNGGWKITTHVMCTSHPDAILLTFN